METLNNTPFSEGRMIGAKPDGQSFYVQVVKATFALPGSDAEKIEVASEQLPFFGSDEYDDSISGPVKFESDLVLFKPRSDIALVGSAHAPEGKPIPELDVSLKVGEVSKKIRVFGDRQWHYPSRLKLEPIMSEPAPFVQMPLTYDRAFGGMDHKGGAFSPENFQGTGIIGARHPDSADETVLPNLEDPVDLISSWDSRPKPACFGFYARGSQPRVQYAGTYDDQWRDEHSPDLPEDFSLNYNNGAHPDLIYPGYLRGDEVVELENLLPGGGCLKFRLPRVHPSLVFNRFKDPMPPIEDIEKQEGAKLQAYIENPEGPMPTIDPMKIFYDRPTDPVPVEMVLDTLVFVPDDGVFYQVWRGLYPLRGGLRTDPETDQMNESVLEIHSIQIETANI
jgi:hypothetical protein